ncbi:transcriptional regulator [Saccharomonospora marina XMU15]|uniref:Transcriptional regulator n=1 Tax=Saccharomonospora marina XMU15 TaxID=882083 RepID=H5X4L0_9PSEU|nr:TetR/AcrR family transcriptional regulator [Saccharomonospora marina]EHR49991.1 transcriptional regulator [Saccharomonospora marina XMU15]
MAEGVNRRDGRAERWRDHRAARRAAFVDAAFRALDEHGPDAGMAHLARAAGVSKPRLYRHFADKADLVAAVAERVVSLVRCRLEPALREPAPPRMRVREGVRAYLGVVAEHPNVFRFLCRHRYAEQASRDRQVAAAVIAAMLTDQLGGFGIESDGVRPWAHGLVGAVEAAGSWWLDHPGMDIEQVTDHITTLVWGALEAALREEGVPPGGGSHGTGNTPQPARGRQAHGSRS